MASKQPPELPTWALWMMFISSAIGAYLLGQQLYFRGM